MDTAQIDPLLLQLSSSVQQENKNEQQSNNQQTTQRTTQQHKHKVKTRKEILEEVDQGDLSFEQIEQLIKEQTTHPTRSTFTVTPQQIEQQAEIELDQEIKRVQQLRMREKLKLEKQLIELQRQKTLQLQGLQGLQRKKMSQEQLRGEKERSGNDVKFGVGERVDKLSDSNGAADSHGDDSGGVVVPDVRFHSSTSDSISSAAAVLARARARARERAQHRAMRLKSREKNWKGAREETVETDASSHSLNQENQQTLQTQFLESVQSKQGLSPV